jgi:hypothetical protein
MEKASGPRGEVSVSAVVFGTATGRGDPEARRPAAPAAAAPRWIEDRCAIRTRVVLTLPLPGAGRCYAAATAPLWWLRCAYLDDQILPKYRGAYERIA